MSRIKGIDLEKHPELQSIFDAGKSIMGFVPNDGLIMAHQPLVLKSFLGLVQSIYTPGEVDQGLKRMVGLIASSASGCQYCQAHAANSAHMHSVEEAKIKAVWEFQTSDLFSEKEKTTLQFALHASMVPNATTEEDFSKMRKYYTDKQIIEVLSVISMYGFLNRWNSTLKTTLEDKPNDFFEKIKTGH